MPAAQDDPARFEVVTGLRMALREYLGAADAFDEQVAHRLGIGRADLRCLDLLERRGMMTAGELAEAAGMSTGSMTFVLDRLERAGLVARRRDTRDRRRVLVEVVPAGNERAFGLHLALVMELRGLVARYRTEELAVVRDFLVSARQIYERHLRPGDPATPSAPDQAVVAEDPEPTQAPGGMQ